MALFFGLNQALFFQRSHIVLHPLDLVPAQSTALNVHGDAGEMGRSDLAFRGSRVAIVAASFFWIFTVRTAEFTWIEV